MQTHNPQILWRSHAGQRLSLQVPSVYITCNTIESPETPPEYHKFKEAFKAKASGLPPHQPYDYIIKLLAGSTPTRNHIYPSSAKETQAVNEYIEEVLQQGYIHPSTSSPSTTYVFVEKIQGGLRPLVPSAL